MTINCPHCGKENNVAGLYFRPCRQGQRTEGDEQIRLYCCWCGKAFIPQEVTERVADHAMQGSGI